MNTVGIIANPRAGKDIRRLVAHGSVLDTQEKVYIVRRAILGLEGAGIDEIVFFPDPASIGPKALSGIEGDRKAAVRMLEMSVYDEAADSTRAAALMQASLRFSSPLIAPIAISLMLLRVSLCCFFLSFTAFCAASVWADNWLLSLRAYKTSAVITITATTAEISTVVSVISISC